MFPVNPLHGVDLYTVNLNTLIHLGRTLKLRNSTGKLVISGW